MQKTILITGSTDGIGLAAARMMAEQGHTILLHGRSSEKLERVKQTLAAQSNAGRFESYVADLSELAAVENLAQAVASRSSALDVLINNAGVYSSSTAVTGDGLNTVFAVNTIAPYLLTQRLLPAIPTSGRVVNLSSAAQAPVNLQALAGKVTVSDQFNLYAQSKLALTIWSRELGLAVEKSGPIVVSVNPGSMLGTKMVKNAFGVAGNDIQIGADILTRAALSDEFAGAAGLYFDNDAGRFASPHPDGLDPQKTAAVVQTIEAVLGELMRG